jgi:hypothetical protein
VSTFFFRQNYVNKIYEVEVIKATSISNNLNQANEIGNVTYNPLKINKN